MKTLFVSALLASAGLLAFAPSSGAVGCTPADSPVQQCYRIENDCVVLWHTVSRAACLPDAPEGDEGVCAGAWHSLDQPDCVIDLADHGVEFVSCPTGSGYQLYRPARHPACIILP